MVRVLFLTFLIVPLIEIGLFILIGQAIGLWPTLLGVVVTALIGSYVIRLQGVSLIQEIRAMTARGRMPARQIADGFMLAIAGALLLTPGYFTDAVGFLLLVPPVRLMIFDFLKSRIEVVATSSSYSYRERGYRRRRPSDDDVVDLDDSDWRDGSR